MLQFDLVLGEGMGDPGIGAGDAGGVRKSTGLSSLQRLRAEKEYNKIEYCTKRSKIGTSPLLYSLSRN